MTNIKNGQASAQWYLTLFQHNPLPMWFFDTADFRILDVNEAAVKHYGYSRDELLAMTILDIRPLEDRELVLRTVPDEMERAGCEPHQFGIWRHRCKDDSVRLVDVTGFLTCYHDRRAICIIANDVTEQQRKDEVIRESEAEFRALFEQAAVGISLTAPDGRLSRVNRKFCEIVGYSVEELESLSFEAITHPLDIAEDSDNREKLLCGEQQTYAMEKRYIRKDGKAVWTQLTVSLRRDAAGQPKYFIAVVEGIEARKASEARAEHLTTHDELTNLPKRNLLLDRLEQAIGITRRTNRMVAVLSLDLDRFKLINDSLGHNYGDRLLQVTAERLARVVQEGDTVARLSGDEFVLALESVADEDTVMRTAQKIIDVISQPVRLDSHDLTVSTSVGISLFPKDGDNAGSLLKSAEAAMYQAKEVGGGSFQFYDPEMNTRVFERLLMENGLKRALEQDELTLHYQPRVNLRSGRIEGMEALVRWRHPEKGLVCPGNFIPLAEEIGLIGPIGEWVLRAASVQLDEWRQQGLPDLKVSVNVSARQLNNPGLVAFARQVLRETGVDARQLELEITESSLMVDVEKARAVLLELAGIGFRIAIDDFGTGYSSLSYLKRLPIDALKIDASFIRDLVTDPDDAAIVEATIALAHGMHLCVVAEGVQSEDQLAFLERHGCDEVQGYLLSPPRPAQEMEKILRGDGLPFTRHG